MNEYEIRARLFGGPPVGYLFDEQLIAVSEDGESLSFDVRSITFEDFATALCCVWASRRADG